MPGANLELFPLRLRGLAMRPGLPGRLMDRGTGS